ncbi:hypothetical protein [Bacillus sp. T33-2]|uniref:hypothetical protein n=1 Tax=Bacillus sp. T33-2 TaxID=2054168 RepID=UPI000C7562EA|nr:hypothetical protein [Bacillus sp. T33-2]PLR99283.1 hypothetical protein CVD19_02925 [Bacillus sp. T33-2]
MKKVVKVLSGIALASIMALPTIASADVQEVRGLKADREGAYSALDTGKNITVFNNTNRMFLTKGAPQKGTLADGFVYMKGLSW